MCLMSDSEGKAVTSLQVWSPFQNGQEFKGNVQQEQLAIGVLEKCCSLFETDFLN